MYLKMSLKMSELGFQLALELALELYKLYELYELCELALGLYKLYGKRSGSFLTPLRKFLQTGRCRNVPPGAFLPVLTAPVSGRGSGCASAGASPGWAFVISADHGLDLPQQLSWPFH